MDLQIIQKAIQTGYVFSENDSGDVEWELSIINHFYVNSDFFNNIEDEDIEDILDTDDKEMIFELSKILGKERIVSLYTNNGDENSLTEIYKILEDTTWVYRRELEELSKDDLDMYCEYLNKSDVYYDEFVKTQDFFKWSLDKFKNNKELNDEEIKLFLDSYIYNDLFTKEICLSNSFQNSLNNYPQDKHLWSNDKYEAKTNICLELINKFESEEVKLKIIETQYGIREEYFMSEEEIEEQIENDKKEEELQREKRFENLNGRLSKSDCEWYLNKNNFSAEISINEGHIGLENMSFDFITIDGERQGEEFDGRAWISGRSFGDNKLETSYFLNTVNKYKVV